MWSFYRPSQKRMFCIVRNKAISWWKSVNIHAVLASLFVFELVGFSWTRCVSVIVSVGVCANVTDNGFWRVVGLLVRWRLQYFCLFSLLLLLLVFLGLYLFCVLHIYSAYFEVDLAKCMSRDGEIKQLFVGLGRELMFAFYRCSLQSAFKRTPYYYCYCYYY